MGRLSRSQSSPRVVLLASRTGPPGFDRVERDRSSRPAIRPAQADPAVHLGLAQQEVALHDEHFGVDGGVPGVREARRVEVDRPGDARAAEAYLTVCAQSGRPEIVAHGRLVELEHRLLGVRSDDLRALHVQAPGDLRPGQPHHSVEPAPCHPQHAVHPHRVGGETRQHRLAEVEFAQPGGVEAGHLVEGAVPQPDRVVDRRVLQIEPAGDPGARQTQRRYLPCFLRPVEQQRPQHLGAHGLFGPPAAAEGHVLVVRPAEVHGLAQREGPPHLFLCRCQIVDLHQAGL